jgi:dehydrogenase/reductase SDR family protein 12
LLVLLFCCCFLLTQNDTCIIYVIDRTGYLHHIQDVKYYTADHPVQNAAYLKADTTTTEEEEEGTDGTTGGSTVDDGVDMTGKVVVVTGANSGLGFQVATYVASKGAKLFMLCRSEERAVAAKLEIEKLVGVLTKNNNKNADIEIVVCDVSELSHIRKAVQELQSKTDKIDCLVCNAGVLLNERQESSEGHELTFASHFLGGAYLLSKLLVPQLQAATDKQGRCIFVTSGGMYNFPFPSWDKATSNPEKDMKYDGVNVYAYAKRGQVLLAEEFAKEYPDVTWVTVHPGWTDTPAVEEAFGDQKKYLQPLRTPWQGAEGVVWLTQTDSSNLVNGEFYLDRIVQPKHLSGPFFSEGSFTKNKPKEVQAMMENLKKAAGI